MQAGAEAQLLAELRRLSLAAEPLKARAPSAICLEIARWALDSADAQELLLRAEGAGLHRAAAWLEKGWSGMPGPRFPAGQAGVGWPWVAPSAVGLLELGPGRAYVRFPAAGIWSVNAAGGELRVFSARGRRKYQVPCQPWGGLGSPVLVESGLCKIVFLASHGSPRCLLRRV